MRQMRGIAALSQDFNECRAFQLNQKAGCTVLELLSSIAFSNVLMHPPDQQPEIVVVLAGTRRSQHQHGILVSCVITEQNERYLEITCAD